VRLWLRDALILKATGDAGLMEGPPPDGRMLAFVERSTLKGLGGSEGALARLFDSVSRNIRPDLAFENFWLSVL
jgi:hypothetical protein